MLTPPLRVGESILIGGMYANDAFMLCGDRLCGGTLDFPAAKNASRRPSQTVPFAGPSVDQLSLGVRSRCASISSAHAQCFLLPVSAVTKVCPTHSRYFDLSIHGSSSAGCLLCFQYDSIALVAGNDAVKLSFQSAIIPGVVENHP